MNTNKPITIEEMIEFIDYFKIKKIENIVIGEKDIFIRAQVWRKFKREIINKRGNYD
jgi:hypothetical protein